MKVNVVSDKEQPMMVISSVGRKGSTLEITGQLMGAWPSKMYIKPKEFLKMLLKALSPGVIVFIVLFPFFLVYDIFRKGDKN